MFQEYAYWKLEQKLIAAYHSIISHSIQRNWVDMCEIVSGEHAICHVFYQKLYRNSYT